MKIELWCSLERAHVIYPLKPEAIVSLPVTYFGNCFSHPNNFRLCRYRILIPGRAMLPTQGLLRVSVNLKLWLLSGHLGLLMPIYQQEQMELPIYKRKLTLIAMRK